MQTILLPLLIAAAAFGTAPAIAQETPFGDAKGIETTDLAAITGQANVAMEVRAQNTATVSHNSVSGISETGTIHFDADSFQAMSGLSLLSANTGNNVSINSSLNVNVSIQPQ